MFGRLRTLPASQAELAAVRLDQAQAVLAAATWPQPRTLVVANVKGGSGKTAAATIIAGLLAQTRGPVAAFEACETRGTLAQRCDGGGAGIAALLDSDRDPIRSLHDLSPFLAYQESRAMVLASPQPRPQLSGAIVTGIHRLLAGYFSVLVIDTANNPEHEAWLAAVGCADAVLIPCWANADSVAGALECLTALDQHPNPAVSDPVTGARSRVVVIVADPRGSADQMPHLARLKAAGVARFAGVPFDPALKRGDRIVLSQISVASLSSWTLAARTVVELLQASAHETREEGHVA